ncbi:UNVERIFIED_CONTAM: hypothetical protein FKN15_071310 [Acipenser sinensis]
MASNSSSCPTPQGGAHLNSFPMQHYPFFFPHVIRGLSPPGLPALQHQLPVSGYSTPSPASRYPAVFHCQNGFALSSAALCAVRGSICQQANNK